MYNANGGIKTNLVSFQISTFLKVMFRVAGWKQQRFSLILKMYHFLAIVTLLGVLGCISGKTVIDVEEILGARGMFNRLKVEVSELGRNAAGEAVPQLSKALDAPGVLDSAYRKFARKFWKLPEEMGGRKVFKDNVLAVFEHNINAKAGLKSFTMGINEFSDLTLKEVIARYTGAVESNVTRFDRYDPTVHPRYPPYHRSGRNDIPASKNWVTLGKVSPVKRQGPCGSCVMFALTAALESVKSIYHKPNFLDLSEQELLDCVKGKGIGGCAGNYPNGILAYMMKHGQTSESLYPYEGIEGTCVSAGKPRYARVNSSFLLRAGDETQLKQYVANYGPVFVLIVVNEDFRNYEKGVMNTPCKDRITSHALLVVGYGREDNQDYWLAKNSWGTGWGDQGFIKMARNSGSICRIADYARLVQV